jgi:hypothetical protein
MCPLIAFPNCSEYPNHDDLFTEMVHKLSEFKVIIRVV